MHFSRRHLDSEKDFAGVIVGQAGNTGVKVYTLCGIIKIELVYCARIIVHGGPALKVLERKPEEPRDAQACRLLREFHRLQRPLDAGKAERVRKAEQGTGRLC
jgi:hypothetical protein